MSANFAGRPSSGLPSGHGVRICTSNGAVLPHNGEISGRDDMRL